MANKSKRSIFLQVASFKSISSPPGTDGEILFTTDPHKLEMFSKPRYSLLPGSPVTRLLLFIQQKNLERLKLSALYFISVLKLAARTDWISTNPTFAAWIGIHIGCHIVRNTSNST